MIGFTAAYVLDGVRVFVGAPCRGPVRVAGHTGVIARTRIT